MKTRKLIDHDSGGQGKTTRKIVYRATLRRIMTERGLTQADIASMAGVTQSNVSLWLLNDMFPRADALYALAAALGVSMEFLLTGESESGARGPSFQGNAAEIRRLAKETRAALATLDDALKKI